MSMSIYVYAILFSHEKKINLPQGFNGKVELIVYENIAAIIEREISIQKLQETEDSLLKAVVTHDRVIQDIFSQVSLLTVRFGTGFASTNNLLDHFKDNQQKYIKQLQALDNKVEYAVKFLPLTFQPNDTKHIALKGKNYLLTKKKNYQLYQEFIFYQETQWQQIKEIATQEFSERVLIKEQEDIKQIFLLEEQNTNIDILINTWQQKASNWQITISQPLPCYHFTFL
ncbi:MAG: GvpL/GvpF family gas vesicle protein [Xenococcaceae cyanobacterium]